MKKITHKSFWAITGYMGAACASLIAFGVAPPRAEAYLTDCIEVDAPYRTSYNVKYMVCQEYGNRWFVQCDNYNRNCIKICNIDGYSGRRCN